ncbi:MAG: insulinase family protein [Bryobacteraceae bacterium]|nr:insulinase family protein [Bryobacteraceae bacterium]
MSAPPMEARDIRSTTFPNGVRVITESMRHVRSVSVGIWIGSGTRRETDEQNGISHFIEHMVFKGTENRTAEEIARSVDSIGGNLDAFTAKELVSFNTKVLDEHLPIAFGVLSDLVLRPLFSAADIEREKGVVLEELKMENDSPEYLVHELFCGRFWKGHSLGKPILGTRRTIRGFNRAMVESYYRQVYDPSNILITAAGNLDHARLLDLAGAEFSNLKPNGSRAPESSASPHPHLLLKSKKSLEQIHICLGVPCYPVAHEARYACYILNTLLGGGMSSRLFQNIRERRGLAYSVFSELNLYRDTGCLMVSAGTSLESSEKVIRLTLDEFRRFKDELISPEELRRAKDQLKGSLMLSLESTSSRMANLARQELYFGRFFDLDEILASIEAVTAEQVRQISAEFFQPGRIALTLLGELNGLRMSRRELAC